MRQYSFPVRAPVGHEAELRQFDPGDRWSVRTRPIGRDYWDCINTQDADTPDPVRAAFDVRRWIEDAPARFAREDEFRRRSIARWGCE